MTKPFPTGKGGIMVIAGTRPEMIKIAPVVRQLARHKEVRVTLVSTDQQADMLPAFVGLLGVDVDCQLGIMARGQSLNRLLSEALAALDPVIAQRGPALVVVQGDTTTALAGALAARMRNVSVAHIEAGLRTGDSANPFPEETNRCLIAQAAALHLAPTARNRDALLAEGVPAGSIVVTGNPIVASLQDALGRPLVCPRVNELLKSVQGLKSIVVTTHRRESLDGALTDNLRTLRAYVEQHTDTALIVPVHLNPRVKETIELELSGCERVHLIEPLDYVTFLHLLQAAWLIVSDSGGVQEEVASLGKPLLVLRSRTERPEAIEAGVARLAGERPGHLAELLSDREALERWIDSVGPVENPFGDAESPSRIVRELIGFLAAAPRRAGVDS